ncbi:MAG: chromate transporter [Actinobacteria bacterium]|nr:chromate transporter [Actinomycetota bacterium]
MRNNSGKKTSTEKITSYRVLNRITASKKMLSIFWTFFKIGSFTFGGGYAMIPLIEREVVSKRKWITESKMVDIIAISQSFPGAVAINSATMIGREIGGYSGAFLATLGVVLPSFLIITAVAKVFTYIEEIPIVRAAFQGINSVIVALLITAALRIGKTSIKDRISPLITITGLALLLGTKIHPIYIIVIGIFSGLIFYTYKKISGKVASK